MKEGSEAVGVQLKELHSRFDQERRRCAELEQHLAQAKQVMRINNSMSLSTLSTIPVASSRRSERELGRVALPTVHSRLALSGKLCFYSLWPVTNVTGQGNGLRSQIVREERGGPGITVKAKNKK